MEVGPEPYESITGIGKVAYERQLVVATRAEMTKTINESAPARSGLQARGSVESVALVGKGLDASIVVMLRLDEIPGVRCGWRRPIWPAQVPDGNFEHSPEGQASLSALGIVEIVESTPRAHLLALDRDADGILWL
jgi:hypothetical protein